MTVVIPIKYDGLHQVGEGMVMYMAEPQRWGIMEFNQKIITKPIFTHTGVFINGKIKLQQNDGVNYMVTPTGEIRPE